MASSIPKDRTITALGEVWSSLSDLLGDLTDDEWCASSPLPGWSVQDNVAHIVGTEAMLAGESGPIFEIDRDVNQHVRNDIGAFNEQWVESLRAVAPSDVLQAPVLAGLVVEAGYTSVAVAARADDYGVPFLEETVKGLEARGATVVLQEAYDPEAGTFDSVVDAMVGSGADAHVIISFVEGAQIVRWHGVRHGAVSSQSSLKFGGGVKVGRRDGRSGARFQLCGV